VRSDVDLPDDPFARFHRRVDIVRYSDDEYAALCSPSDDALRAVTLWPAQIFGMADRFGSLEAGRVANVVVTTGDLLEARTDTKYLFIDGRPVPLETRHSTLYMTHKDRK
jgi:cytosine/adenosine deaminase-related metal-dependent hydrolase